MGVKYTTNHAPNENGDSNEALATHCCAGRGAAWHRVTLTQQDTVHVDVHISAGVTQVEVQRVAAVTIQSPHQGLIGAQHLESSRGLSGPGALQLRRHMRWRSECTGKRRQYQRFLTSFQ